MNKNLFFSVMLVMALVFGMTVVGCDNDTTSGGSDTWSNITSFSQMNGTWKSSYSQNNRPIKDVMEEQGMDWTPDMQTMFGNMRVTSRADITLTINANAKTWAMSVTSTGTYSGGNIDTVWPMLKQSLEILEEEGVTVTANDANHSITMTYSFPAETMSDAEIAEMLDSGLQINQNGRKIKVPANSLEQGMPELIFNKQ
jgi:hypothetical protein